MFTPIILLCSAAACVALGGPIFETEKECQQAIQVGIQYALTNVPDKMPVDATCVAWGKKT